MLPEICDALERAGIVTPFAIQEMTLSVALMGTDLIGQARTGTGKTLAFGIPVLQRSVTPTDPAYADMPQGKPQALIVAPTRELALQVSNDLHLASKDLGLRVLTVYGGVGYDTQLDTLESGVDVVVGTPGRLIDLANRRALDLSHVHALVLDEADEMLDLGFLPDVERLLVDDPRDPPDDAVLGDHAGRDRGAGPHPHAAPDEHPRRVVVRHHDGAGDRAVHLPGPRPRQAGDHRPGAPGRGRRQDHRLHPHQAAGAAGRRRPGRARLQHQPAARRHGPGRPREGPGEVPRGQDPGPGRDRRRRPRHRRRRRLARHQLHLPRGRQDLRPPDRPHRPRRRLGHRDHVRRLAGHRALEDDQQDARPAVRRAAGDVLHVRAPLPRPGHRPRAPRAASSTRRRWSASPARTAAATARAVASVRVATATGTATAAAPGPAAARTSRPRPARRRAEGAKAGRRRVPSRGQPQPQPASSLAVARAASPQATATD